MQLKLSLDTSIYQTSVIYSEMYSIPRVIVFLKIYIVNANQRCKYIQRQHDSYEGHIEYC